MLGQLFIYPLFVASCVAGIFRPYWGLVGFYAFVFLEPEWNWRWSIPFGSNFQKYIGACVLIGFLITGLRGNRLRGWLGAASAALVLFLALAYLAATATIDAKLTAYYLDIITKVIVMALVTIKVVDTPRKAWILLWVIAVGQGYSAFRINEQYFEDGYSLYATIRSWGFKGDNNLYSIFTIPAIGASFALAVHSEKKWQRFLAGAVLLLQAHQLMLMESRGGMIGAIGLLGFGALIMPKNAYTIRSAVIAMIGVSALAGPPVVREFMSSFESEENRDSSADSRFKLWKAGFQITMDNPALGVGPYAGQVMVPKYAPEYAHQYRKGLHNLFFEISTGCGIPALACYLAFFFIPWWKAFWFYWRHRYDLGIESGSCLLAMVVGIPGYFIASMFSSGALLESAYVLVACGAACLCIAQQELLEANAADVDPPDAVLAGASMDRPQIGGEA